MLNPHGELAAVAPPNTHDPRRNNPPEAGNYLDTNSCCEPLHHLVRQCRRSEVAQVDVAARQRARDGVEQTELGVLHLLGFVAPPPADTSSCTHPACR